MAEQFDRLQAALADRYEIEHELGHGGMATVYLAQDLKHHRRVAIKVLKPELAATLGPARFLREIEIAAQLQHPHILPLHDSGEADGHLYYVMPYVEGDSLRRRLRRERQLPLDEALAIAREVADALSYAHNHDVVHRDIKPENILLASGHALVADFGIARAITAAAGERLTHTGLTVGTPGYMSPEQASGDRHLDGRSDQYSLACVLYEMLAGEPPYTGPTAQAIVAKQLTEPLPHLGTVRAVPGPVEAAITKALAKVPADRFSTVAGFAVALERPYAPTRRWPMRATVGASLSLVLLGGLVIRLLQRGNPAVGTAGPPGAPIKARRSVAVLGFKNLSGRPDEAWLSTALSEMLTTELAAGEQLRTISGEDIAHMKINLSLPDADSYGRETLARIRTNLATDDVVLGSYVPLGGGRIRLDLRLQDTQAGETLTAVSEKGSEEHIDDLVGRAGTALRQRLGAGEISRTAYAAVRASLPSNPVATRLYSEGLAKLRVFDALGARDLLERAVAAEPNYALAHSALAAAWSALLYGRKAQEEAKKAFDLSTNLPREERLAVEGRYRETTRDWKAAVEIYTTLWGFFPDNLDYGLRLADAQTKGGRGTDAMTTVAALHKRQPPQGDDPRIDIAEARAAYTLGDNRRAQAAAARGAAKGEAQGGKLLVAAARISEGNAFDALGEPGRARAAYEEAQRIYAAAGDSGASALALNNFGILLYDQGDLSGARAMYERALAIFRAIGDTFAVAAVLNNIGNALKGQGDLAGARRAQVDALTIRRDIGDKSGMAQSLLNIGTILHREGDLAGAKRSYQESASIGREIADRSQISIALHNLGGVLIEQGDLVGAKKTLDEALAMRRQMGDKTGQAYTLEDLGELATQQGDLVAARKSLEEALAIRRALGEKGNVAQSDLGLASVAIEEGRPAEAEGPARQAVEEFRSEHAASAEAEAWTVLARSLLEQGQPAQAQEAIAHASELAGKTPDSTVRWSVGIVAARVLASRSRPADAKASLRAILAATGKYGFVGDGLEASLALGETEMKSGENEAGRARLVVLEKDATAKGFFLLARKAHTAGSH
jgi:eukaryotic-like serine/threonine-protein kinase